MIQSTRGNYHESKENCASNLNSARQLEESVLNPRILGECSIALAATCAKGNADLRVSFLADVSLAKCKMETGFVAYTLTALHIIEATVLFFSAHQNKAHLIDASHNQTWFLTHNTRSLQQMASFVFSAQCLVNAASDRSALAQRVPPRSALAQRVPPNGQLSFPNVFPARLRCTYEGLLQIRSQLFAWSRPYFRLFSCIRTRPILLMQVTISNDFRLTTHAHCSKLQRLSLVHHAGWMLHRIGQHLNRRRRQMANCHPQLYPLQD